MWIPKNMYCIRKNNLKKKMRMRAAEDADWMRDAFGCLFFFSLLFPYWLRTMIRVQLINVNSEMKKILIYFSS